MSDRRENSSLLWRATVVLQILSLVILAPSFANAWEWPWSSGSKPSVPSLPLEKLLANNPTERDRLFSDLQASIRIGNKEYIAYLDRCTGFERVDHRYIIRDVPFVIFEEPSFGLKRIAEALNGAGIIDQLIPTKVEREPIYKRLELFSPAIDLSWINISTGLLGKDDKNRREVKPRMLEFFEILVGSMTMTGHVDGFLLQSGYNPYSGNDPHVQKVGEVDIYTFAATLEGRSSELYVLVKNKESGGVEKAEIRLGRGVGIQGYIEVYSALQQSAILPGKYVNHYSNEEQIVLANLMKTTDKSSVEILPRKEIERFLNASDNSILIVPDLHDSPASMAFSLNLLQDERVQGIGLEVSSSGQSEFNAQNKTGDLFRLTGALKEIDSKWNYRRKWQNDVSVLEESDQKKFRRSSDMELVHAVSSVRQKPVVFIDAELPYLDARAICGQKLAHMTRNLIWAKKLPRSGKFVVLGGSAHFAQDQAVNFQDFFSQMYPSRRIFMLEY